ncbi:hypothetical protein EG850_12680 [Gulosibacter macacae]|uniref:Uncharacterized protein n=1 Tax=Gulosibacter macacae TaxID=2488791 RepID=A0A3P3VS90_9MICO|nr:hypothetical protein [Gulosibacter macacae]RRJ85615.1 hypothetical protein EG850_12680 [Gulosibacter macacae]
MSEREKSDSERPEPGESWTGFNIPEFGERASAEAVEATDATELEPRSEGMSFAEALETHAGGSDWASEQTRAAEERGATSESRTDWTAIEGQYIASGDDANSWAAGQEWAEERVAPAYEAVAPHPAPPIPAPSQSQPQPSNWQSLPQSAPQQHSPASSTEKPSRKGLIFGLAVGAVVVIGAIITAVLLLPGMLGGTAPTTAAESSQPAPPPETSAAPANDAVNLSGTWDGTTRDANNLTVSYVIYLEDDGTTVSGTVDYESYGCTSRLEQAARDDSTVTLNEYGVSGSCNYDDAQIILHLPTASNPNSANLEIGTKTGTLLRRS